MKNKKKGFTLIELLVTIAIIGLIGSIGTYFIINTINNSKDKSNTLTINNIKTSTNTYVKEYNNEIIWEFSSDNKEKSCISINTLISKGYLKKDILDNKEIPKSIIITRDENKNIISEEEISEDCNTYKAKVEIPSSKNICNNIIYDGNEHNIINNTISQSNYTIKYKDDNYNTNPPINAGNYKIEVNLTEGKVWQDNTTTSKEIICTIKKATPELILTPTGTPNTELGTQITRLISNTEGTISIKSSNKSHATASTDTKEIITNHEKIININILATRDTNTYITITLTPKDTTNYQTTSIKYTIGKITNQKISIPTCINSYFNNNTQTLIEENKAYNLYGNTAKEINYYPVTAKLNYGYTWSDGTTNDITLNCEIKRPLPLITYINASCSPSTKTVSYKNEYGTLCTPTKKGYTFEGWYTDTNYTIKIAENSIVENYNNHSLYAKWRKNKINVQYHMNGGTWKGTNPNYSYNDEYITLQNSTIVDTFYYGDTNINLHNYNNPDYINITKSGYSALPGKEWITDNGTTFNQTQNTELNASNLCDASNNDCTITLKVNWIQEGWITENSCKSYYKNGTKLTGWQTIDETKYYFDNNGCNKEAIKVTFYPNYKEGTTKTETFIYGTPNQKFTTTFSRTGYILLGWSTDSSATSPTYSVSSAVTDSWINYNKPEINLYAIWIAPARSAITTTTWYMWIDPGYVMDKKEVYSYHDCNSSATKYTIKSAGTTKSGITVYTNEPVVKKTFNTCNKTKVFYKIYIKEADTVGSKYGTKLTSLKDTITINNTTYYGVWIAESCKNQDICPNGTSIKFQ